MKKMIMTIAMASTMLVSTEHHVQAQNVPSFSRQDYTMEWSVRSMVLRDFNNDSVIDIVLYLMNEKISVFLGEGDGTFKEHTTFGCPYAYNILADDLRLRNTHPNILRH